MNDTLDKSATIPKKKKKGVKVCRSFQLVLFLLVVKDAGVCSGVKVIAPCITLRLLTSRFKGDKPVTVHRDDEFKKKNL